MTLARRIAPLVIALFIAWPAPVVLGQGGDDAVVAVNTRDGSQVFRFSFNVRRVMGDVVDTSNAAVAFASCDSCQTVAISIQLVLVSGSPEVVTPENLAIAINQGCDVCETLASAYQFVLGVGGAPVHFSAEGNRILAELRQELARLRHANLPVDELQARVEAVVARLRDVLQNELVYRPPKNDAADDPPSTDEREPPPATTGTQPTTDEQPTGPLPTDTTETTPPATETTETGSTPSDTTPTETVPTQTEPTETEAPGETTEP